MKPLVFISYSRADETRVARICNDLALRNVPYWRDAKEIKVGDSISQKIEDAISKATHFCLCLSKNSNRSVWVEREYRSALTRQLRDATLRILPLLLEDCEIPPLLADIRYADFSTLHQDGLQALLDAVGSPDAPKRAHEKVVPYKTFIRHIEQREPLTSFLNAAERRERSSLNHDWAARMFALLEGDIRRCRKELENLLSLGVNEFEVVLPTASRQYSRRTAVMLCPKIVIDSSYVLVSDDNVSPTIAATAGFLEFLQLLIAYRDEIAERKLYLLPEAFVISGESYPDGMWDDSLVNTDLAARIDKMHPI